MLKILKLKKKIQILLLLLVLSLAFINNTSAAITATQNSNILTVSNSVDVNVTIAFYDNHQVFVSQQVNFTAYPSVNVTIPVSLAGIGGYYRVSLVNESVSSKSFVEIAVWDQAQGNGNNNQQTVNSSDNLNDTAYVLPAVLDSDNSGSIDGEYFLISASLTGLIAVRQKAIRGKK